MKSFEVVIVGAGIAGLNAARILHAAGVSFTIVEARDRIGGRIFTLHEPGVAEPIELGAEFVHGLPIAAQEVIVPEVDLIDRDGEYLVASDTGPKVDESFFEKLRSVLDELPFEGGEDLSFAEFLLSKSSEVPFETMTMVKNYVEGYHGADTQKISAQVLGQVERESVDAGAVDGAYFFKDGWGRLIDRMAHAFKNSIRLNHCVTQIDRSGDGVVVSYQAPSGLTERLQARAVLVTVPVGVLHAPAKSEGAIEFNPALPASHLTALTHLTMGEAIRIGFRFKEAFWEKAVSTPDWALLIDLAPEAKLRTWWSRGKILVGWIGGPRTSEWKDLSDSARRAYGVIEIARLFKVPESEVARLLEATYFHDWASDPYARGVYNYVRVGGQGAQEALAQPVDSKLYFAGEATCEGGYSGTANGALISSENAVRRILKALRD